MEPEQQIELFKNFFKDEKTPIREASILNNLRAGKKTAVFDFWDISKFDPELATELLERPEDALIAAEIAIEQGFDDARGFKVRIKNVPSQIKIRHIRTKHIGKLFSIEGTIRQISMIHPLVTAVKFECPNCGNIMNVIQLGKQIKEPSRCGCGRRGKFHKKETTLIDTQRMILEESIELLEGNEQPRTISVLLFDDLTSPEIDKKNTPGTRIALTGIINERPGSMKDGEATERDFIINALHIEPVEEEYEEIKISGEEEERIHQLAKNPKVYDLLVKSYAPDIFGYNEVKEAIIYQLVGGVKKLRNGKLFRMGDIHILLVGDPGAGKSKMLKYATYISPKHRYSSGGGASGVGLTAAAVRDEFMRGWALEAGAFVLAHHGIAIIDEFDKIPEEDIGKLHSALSEQFISIDKGNVHATLRSETALLAAANPKLGRFTNEPVPKQIELPVALLNRFDFIFIIKDIPDPIRDRNVIETIISVHQESKEVEPELDPAFLKKYMAYAKQKFNPKLSKEAAEEIKNFYIELRSQGTVEEDEISTIPITPRQGEGLIRVSEAAAKIRLSETVEKIDVERGKKILLFCLHQVAYDEETGKIDIDRIVSEVPASRRSKIAIIQSVLTELEDNIGNVIPLDDIVKRCTEEGLTEEITEEIINKMKREGEIFEPKPGFISLIH